MTPKSWLSLDEQVDLLIDRGLVVPEASFCRATLQHVGYYHLSGYGRFFQVDPGHGDNRYRSGTTFSDIAELQQLDARLRQLCFRPLAAVELALRTGFAHRFAEIAGSYGALCDPQSFHQTGAHSAAVHELVIAELDRSKQPFVTRHRLDGGNYASLPAWIAVEALPFGTLSKAIEYCANPTVATALADDFNVRRQGFSSQVRSFVALRNACAHISRLWNDVSKNPPAVPNNIIRRAKKQTGGFDPHSYYHVFVALDVFASRIDPGGDFLGQVDQLMATNQTYRVGLLNPTPY